MIPRNFYPDCIGLVNIIVLGRAGSYFFQGLFDGHPATVTIPSTHYSRPMEGDPEAIARAEYAENFSLLFDYVNVDCGISYAAFRPHFLEYIAKFGTGAKSIFIARHYAYAKAAKKDVGSIRYIVFQGHMHPGIAATIDDFPGQKIILLVRDPRASFYSFLKISADSAYTMLAFYFCYRVVESYPVKRNMLFVSHEDTNLHFPLVKKKMAEFLKVSSGGFSGISTFYGRPYTGSTLVVRSTAGLYLCRPSPRYVRDDWKSGLSPAQLWFVNTLYSGYIRRFGYPKWTKAGQQKKDIRSFDEEAFIKSLLFHWKGNWTQRVVMSFVDLPLPGKRFRISIVRAVHNLIYVTSMVWHAITAYLKFKRMRVRR